MSSYAFLAGVPQWAALVAAVAIVSTLGYTGAALWLWTAAAALALLGWECRCAPRAGRVCAADVPRCAGRPATLRFPKLARLPDRWRQRRQRARSSLQVGAAQQK